MGDAGLGTGGAKALDPAKQGALRPQMGKAAFCLRFRKEEVPHMAFPAKLGEINPENAGNSRSRERFPAGL